MQGGTGYGWRLGGHIDIRKKNTVSVYVVAWAVNCIRIDPREPWDTIMEVFDEPTGTHRSSSRQCFFVLAVLQPLGVGGPK